MTQTQREAKERLRLEREAAKNPTEEELRRREWNRRRAGRRRPYKSMVSEAAWQIAVFTLGFVLLFALLEQFPYVPEMVKERAARRYAERKRQGIDAFEAAKGLASDQLARVDAEVRIAREKANVFEGRMIALLDSEDGRYVAGSTGAYRRFKELDVEPRYSGGRIQGLGDNAHRMCNDYPGHAVLARLLPDDGYRKAARDMEKILDELKVVCGDFDRLDGRLDLLIAEARRDDNRDHMSLRDRLAVPIAGVRR